MANGSGKGSGKVAKSEPYAKGAAGSMQHCQQQAQGWSWSWIHALWYAAGKDVGEKNGLEAKEEYGKKCFAAGKDVGEKNGLEAKVEYGTKCFEAGFGKGVEWERERKRKEDIQLYGVCP